LSGWKISDASWSGTFWLSLQNTIVITVVSQFFVLVFANILATALAVDFRGRWLIRMLILLPWVAPISLGSIGWLWIFDSIYSVINWTARAVGSVEAAKRYYRALAGLAVDGDGQRPELAEAKTYLAQN